MRFDPRQILSFQQRLSARERMLMWAALTALLVIGFYVFLLDPLQQRQATRVRQIGMKERDLEQVQQLRNQYLDLRRQLDALQEVLNRADAKFSLFPYIESTVSQVVGRERITSMNPLNKEVSEGYREDAVELKLREVELEQLVDMMHRIEKGPHPLRVTRLQVKKRVRDEHKFDVTATVSILKAVGG
jgi:general secretion pathway protein M